MSSLPGVSVAESITGVLGPHMATLIVSLLPVVEPRYGLLIGVAVLGLSIVEAFAASLLAVIILSVALPYVLGAILNSAERGLLSRVGIARRFIAWLRRRSVERVREKYERYEMLGLILFVAVPLPMTGIYTGALAALVLGLEPRKTIPALALGGVASIIITGASAGLLDIAF